VEGREGGSKSVSEMIRCMGRGWHGMGCFLSTKRRFFFLFYLNVCCCRGWSNSLPRKDICMQAGRTGRFSLLVSSMAM
jgi:hypothetical protein